MTHKEFTACINDIISTLNERENMLIDNGGEITEEVNNVDSKLGSLKEFLSSDGLDYLVAVHDSLEAKINRFSKEIEYKQAQKKAAENTLEYFKGLENVALLELGEDRKKSTYGYTLKRTEKISTFIDKQKVNERYAPLMEKALEQSGIPSYIKFTLTTGVKTIDENGGLIESDRDLVTKSIVNSVTLLRPRGKKE